MATTQLPVDDFEQLPLEKIGEVLHAREIGVDLMSSMIEAPPESYDREFLRFRVGIAGAAAGVAFSAVFGVGELVGVSTPLVAAIGTAVATINVVAWWRGTMERRPIESAPVRRVSPGVAVCAADGTAAGRVRVGARSQRRA